MKPLFCVLSVGLFAVIFSSCKKNDSSPTVLSSIKAIDSFSVKKADGSSFNASDIIVTITAGDTILVTVPPYTDLTKLTTVIQFNGKSVSPDSGITLDLSSPVVFTVTAADGSQIKYVVIVKTRGAVFFGTNVNQFFALDAGTGSLVWRDSLPGEFEYCDPQLVNGVIYAASTSGVVYGLDPASGAIKWQFQAGGVVATTPAIVNGTVYFGSDDHNFYAVDLASASLKWKFPSGGPTDSGPSVVNGIVYFGGGDENLYALDAAAGTVIWKFNLNGPVSMAAPLVTNGVVYIGSRSDSLYAVDQVSGSLKWSAKADGFTLELSSPSINNGVIYVGAESGSLFAFDTATGAQLWKSLNALSVYDQPFVYNNTVYVTADDGSLDAVNAQTGVPVWSIPEIYANGSGPIVANGTLYVGGGGSRYFYAFDPASGHMQWRFFTGSALDLSFRPLYVGGK
jgi:eukaryotic-like serine/threonine-protein kinase